MSALRKKYYIRKYDRLGGTQRDIINCALTNDFAGVDEILRQDPEQINAQRTGSGITPLIAASSRGLGDMVDHLLLKDYIDLDLRDDFGKSALDHARIFPPIVAKIMRAKFPDRRWPDNYSQLIYG